MKHQPSRRNFLKVAAATGVGYWVAAGHTPRVSASPNERLGFAGIGVGAKMPGDVPNAGIGERDIAAAARFGDIIALCDVDQRRLEAVGQRYPNAKRYTDYRQLFEEQEKSIDAAVISTPDHMHAPQALMAMRMKKHVYVQKPLCRTLYEAQVMINVANEMGICSQMGNQGGANDGPRLEAEEIKAGVYGDVREIHVWTDRPGDANRTWWPNGPNVIRTMKQFEDNVRLVRPNEAEQLIAAMKQRRAEKYKDLDWDLWLGVAKYREFFPGELDMHPQGFEQGNIYHIFGWRNWWDFSTGPLGDMSCHLANHYMKALDLSTPTSVAAWTTGHDGDAMPSQAEVVFEYPDTPTRKGFKFVWYEGGRKPPQQLLLDHGIPESAIARPSDSLLIGTDGVKAQGIDRRKEGVVVPEVRYAPRYANPDGSIPANQNAIIRNVFEFITAIKENKPELCYLNIQDLAGPFAIAQALGNLAIWVAPQPEEWGETIQWDATSGHVTNVASLRTPGVAEMIKPIYPQGHRLD